MFNTYMIYLMCTRYRARGDSVRGGGAEAKCVYIIGEEKKKKKNK